MNLASHLRDAIYDCKLLLFTDSGFAGDTRTSKSTTGLNLALAGPRAFAPIAAASKGQMVVRHSITEAEVSAMEKRASGRRFPHHGHLGLYLAGVPPPPLVGGSIYRAGGDSQGSGSCNKKDKGAQSQQDEARRREDNEATIKAVLKGISTSMRRIENAS